MTGYEQSSEAHAVTPQAKRMGCRPVGEQRAGMKSTGSRAAQNRREIVAWVGSEILPHEADVRGWLCRHGIAADQVDDVIQEAYCRIASLDKVSHITNGRSYLFRTARNILLEQIRRARIVRIDTVAEIELLNIVDHEPSPERIAAGRRDLRRVQALIARLPDRCRRIFELRRIQGVPQREIAAMLGVTENTVEAQAARGLRLILGALADEASEPGKKSSEPQSRPPSRARSRCSSGALGDLDRGAWR
jgi:RNA polymerase sigma-70 factor (ECF subfamily)